MSSGSLGLATRRPDYAKWSIEELRTLARQLQIADARRKSRRELLDLFAPESG
jgi:hypothetical protein